MSEEQHAKYSPSKLPRIVACPASGLFERSDDNAESNIYADDGTNLHSATREHLDADIYSIDTDIAQKYNLDIPRMDAVQECLDYVWSLRQKYSQNKIPFYDFIETRVTMEGWIPNTKCEALSEVAGTLDYALVVNPEYGPKILHVTDWKFGQGIEVFPDSEQLMAYALGMLKNEAKAITFDEVHLTIVQPRLIGEDHLKTIIVTINSLVDWMGSTLVPALNGIHAKHPLFRPSIKACRWCPNKMTCNARHEMVMQLAVDVFTIHDQLPTPDMPALIALYEKSGIIKDYLKDIAEFMFNELVRGRTVPGYKIVEGKSNRVWADEKKALEWCTKHEVDPDKMFVSKFFTPAAAEKVIGAKLKRDETFGALIVKPAGKPSLVTETDKRMAIEYRDATEIFANLEFPEEI